MIEQIIALLGKPIKDVAKDPTVTSFNVRAKMSKMGGTTDLVLLEAGLDFTTGLDGIVNCVFLHGQGHEAHKAFPEALPEGLQFLESREEVRKRLGSPSRTGEGSLIPGVGKRPPFDGFDRIGYRMTIY